VPEATRQQHEGSGRLKVAFADAKRRFVLSHAQAAKLQDAVAQQRTIQGSLRRTAGSGGRVRSLVL